MHAASVSEAGISGSNVQWLLVESPEKTKWLTPREQLWIKQRQETAEAAIGKEHRLGSKWWGEHHYMPAKAHLFTALKIVVTLPRAPCVSLVHVST